MIETLYATRSPEKGISECYVLVFTSRPATGRKAYVFMEEHGHWDRNLKRFLHEVSSIHAEEEMTYEEALAIYRATRQKLALRGFIHSFVPDCNRNRPHAYRLFEPEQIIA
jgi:hypothetical protein